MPMPNIWEPEWNIVTSTKHLFHPMVLSRTCCEGGAACLSLHAVVVVVVDSRPPDPYIHNDTS